MRIYLASPGSELKASHLAGMPVLLSFVEARGLKWLSKGYQQSFSNILIDSGAFSELSNGKKVSVEEYKDWSSQWKEAADAIAGLDNISGDWRTSLKNYEKIPWGFPTFHDTDPWDLLPELIDLARDRGGWLGIGLKPPRTGKESFIRKVCGSIPEDLHVHGWALRAYTHIRRLDSVDSTNWFRDAMDIRVLPLCKHLTYSECLEIVIKRYQRWTRDLKEPDKGFFG